MRFLPQPAFIPAAGLAIHESFAAKHFYLMAGNSPLLVMSSNQAGCLFIHHWGRVTQPEL
jgi:hypothetical protein